MIRDENLLKATDYSQGQKDAAYSVLGEIVNLLEPFADDMRIVGGWIPSLLYPDREHIGSIDVDVLLNQEKVQKKQGYATIKEILEKNGYRKSSDPKHYFTYIKSVTVAGVKYDVGVDFLSGKYGGEDGSFSKHVDGIKTLPATGGNYAFEFPPVSRAIDYTRPDGAKDVGHVNIVSIVPYIVMKALALGRGKPKDAYDIYCCINGFDGGIRQLTRAFIPHRDRELVKQMREKLSEKFASPDHAGPTDIASFMDIRDPEEAARVRQDAYQKVRYLVEHLSLQNDP